MNLSLLNYTPLSNFRFSENANVSLTWRLAENLIDFSGRGYKVEYLDKQNNTLLLQEYRDASQPPFLRTLFKVTILSALSFSVIGGLLLAGTIAYHRNKYCSLMVDATFVEVVKRSCQQVMKAKVEDADSTLTDRTVSEAEVAFMKNLKLKDMAFGRAKPGITFKIFNRHNHKASMLFSDRCPSNYEIRGDILKQGLNGLKTQNPDMSLYDACENLLTSPENSDILPYFLRSIQNPNQRGRNLDKIRDITKNYFIARFYQLKSTALR